VKKKLKSLPVKVQMAGVGVLLIAVFALGYMLVVSPQHAKAADVQRAIDAEQTMIYKRRAEARAGLHPPTIQTADLFRLARAMPDREDMPGIILTLSQVARAAGISFDLIEPVTASTNIPTTGAYTVDRIHLLFNGDFYGLSDFLYRVRSLVAVRDGKLDASGRLFNIDTLTFNVQGNTFPKISAELFVDAYVYAQPAASSTTTPSTTTTPPPTTTDTSSTDSSSVTASGPVP
jgi:Tfp pilus assembly protein PilO